LTPAREIGGAGWSRLDGEAWLLPNRPVTRARSEWRNLTVAYTPGGPRQNGYADAQAKVRYMFMECSGNDVYMIAAIEPTPHLVVEPARYWIDGREVLLPVGHARPRTPNLTIRGTVRGNGGARSIAVQPDDNPTCLSNGQIVGQAANFWPAKTSHDEKVRILSGFAFDHDGASLPLRNTTVENEHRTQWAQQRRDALARLSQARRDSATRLATARRDSVARAQAAQRQAAQTQGSGATRPTTGPAAARGPLTRAQRQQMAEEEAVRQQEAARQQQVERRMAQEAERERQVEAERQRRAESGSASATI
jgi:hypothetical protein